MGRRREKKKKRSLSLGIREERIEIFSHVDWSFTREKRIGNFNINALTYLSKKFFTYKKKTLMPSLSFFFIS
jgi:hypothetical protein